MDYEGMPSCVVDDDIKNGIDKKRVQIFKNVQNNFAMKNH